MISWQFVSRRWLPSAMMPTEKKEFVSINIIFKLEIKLIYLAK